MDIVITAWALDSYLDLKHKKVFSQSEYKNSIRPDVLLLKTFPTDPKFKLNKFWAPAIGSSPIPSGYKFKWHNVGNGKVQLRAPVGIFSEAFLGEAYVKKTAKQEKRKLEVFRTHLELIQRGQYTECGRLI